MNSNFLYILISIIIFIYVYSEIENKVLRLEEEREILSRKNMTIDLDGNVLRINSKNIIKHLNKIKNNLKTLNTVFYSKSPDNLEEDNVLKQIRSCSVDLDRFKKFNGFVDNFDNDFHRFNKFSSYNNGSKSWREMSSIIIDINIIIELLKNDLYKGRLYLSNLHKLVQMYATLTNHQEFITYDNLFEVGEIVSHDYSPSHQDANKSADGYRNAYTYDYGVEHSAVLFPRINKSDKSQRIEEGISNILDSYGESGEDLVIDNSNMRFDQGVNKTTMRHNDSSLHTQYVSDSGVTFMIKRDIFDNYVPFCDINKIRSDAKKMNKNLIDHGKGYLRNDYDF